MKSLILLITTLSITACAHLPLGQVIKYDAAAEAESRIETFKRCESSVEGIATIDYDTKTKIITHYVSRHFDKIAPSLDPSYDSVHNYKLKAAARDRAILDQMKLAGTDGRYILLQEQISRDSVRVLSGFSSKIWEAESKRLEAAHKQSAVRNLRVLQESELKNRPACI